MLLPDSIATKAASSSWRAAVAAVTFGVLLPAAAWAQQSATSKSETDLLVVPDADALRPALVEPSVYLTGCVLETMPFFRTKGTPELRTYLKRQLHWPAKARDFPNGRVFATFVVDTAGQVRNARIVKGLHPQLDAEVLRVVRTLTGFAPGTRLGKPVSIEMTVPVEFKFR